MIRKLLSGDFAVLLLGLVLVHDFEVLVLALTMFADFLYALEGLKNRFWGFASERRAGG